ncbi:unnamed protein product, partial [Prorocentrum cordatum]
GPVARRARSAGGEERCGSLFGRPPTMQVTQLNDVKVYNLSAGKSLPQFLEEAQKKKQSLRYDQDFRRRIDLIQDFEFNVASNRVRVSPNGEYIAAAGIYAPEVKIFETRELGLKCSRGLNSEVVDFLFLSEDLMGFAFRRQPSRTEAALGGLDDPLRTASTVQLIRNFGSFLDIPSPARPRGSLPVEALALVAPCRAVAKRAGARVPPSVAAVLVEAAVRGAVLGSAPRRTVAAVARSAVSVALFQQRAEAFNMNVDDDVDDELADGLVKRASR